MSTPSLPRLKFDGAKAYADMVGKGLHIPAIAEKSGLSERTVYRFFTNELQTPRTAQLVADALGHSVRRYMSSPETAAAQ